MRDRIVVWGEEARSSPCEDTRHYCDANVPACKASGMQSVAWGDRADAVRSCQGEECTTRSSGVRRPLRHCAGPVSRSPSLSAAAAALPRAACAAVLFLGTGVRADSLSPGITAYVTIMSVVAGAVLIGVAVWLLLRWRRSKAAGEVGAGAAGHDVEVGLGAGVGAAGASAGAPATPQPNTPRYRDGTAASGTAASASASAHGPDSAAAAGAPGTGATAAAPGTSDSVLTPRMLADELAAAGSVDAGKGSIAAAVATTDAVGAVGAAGALGAVTTRSDHVDDTDAASFVSAAEHTQSDGSFERHTAAPPQQQQLPQQQEQQQQPAAPMQQEEQQWHPAATAQPQQQRPAATPQPQQLPHQQQHHHHPAATMQQQRQQRSVAQQRHPAAPPRPQLQRVRVSSGCQPRGQSGQPPPSSMREPSSMLREPLRQCIVPHASDPHSCLAPSISPL
ncbi:hypothetical protein FOA52_008197 [Chlamydomonas sp. UWO 241]|nr:hypothetical protein FOA52_008197 [Chlamydomonas sp. UWO 241]